MNWIADRGPPKIRGNGADKPETPSDLWTACPRCEKMVFQEDLKRRLMVCPHCDHHMRLSAAERFEYLFDAGTPTLLPLDLPALDPLHFTDLKPYSERLAAARKGKGARDAIQVAVGDIQSTPAVVAAFEFQFMGGSMGLAVGDTLLIAARHAVQHRLPLIVFTASGGARMQEGALSLMQMPRSVAAVHLVKAARLPYIVVFTDPTTGGVSASFAMLGDIILAEPGAMICFTGPRVIQETMRETLPEGFQLAEYLLEHGMIDRVVPRRNMAQELGTLLKLLMQPTP